MLSGGNTYQGGVDFSDSIVEDSLELVARSVFCDVNVLEITVETIVSESDQSRADRHEPHLEILKTLHLGEVIIPHGIIRAVTFKRITHRIALAIFVITMIWIVTNNNHHVMVVLVLTLPHVGQSTLYSLKHVLTPSTTKTIVTTTTCAIVFQSSSQLREVTCEAAIVIRLRPLSIILVLNDLTHN